MQSAWIDMNNMLKDGHEALLDLRELGESIQDRLVVLFWELPLGDCQFGKCICARVTMNMGGQGCASGGVGWVTVQIRFDPRGCESDMASCNGFPEKHPQFFIGACASLRTDTVVREK